MLGMLYTVPLPIVFHYFGELNRGLTAWACIGILLTAIRFRWELRGQRWFRITVAAIAVLHLPLVILVPWPEGVHPGYALLPFGMLDYAFVYGCIKIVEKLMTRNAEAHLPK